MPDIAASRMPSRRLLARVAAGAALAVGALTGAMVTAGSAQAASSGPCDIFAAAGTPCVAAHSTVRALFASYNGLHPHRRAPLHRPDPRAVWRRLRGAVSQA
jgi:non-reducing end alpha-L-arabinofuranosidase